MTSFNIQVPINFNFEGTIRSYGFFLLSPNYYDREKHIFSRPLQINDKVVQLEICCNKNASNAQTNSSQFLVVKCKKNVSAQEQSEIKTQISRMLRIDATYLDDFHGIFPTAKEIGYGRLFRSPSLYEDIVKTMTNVNTTFSRTQTMNTLICEHYGTDGAFPSPSVLGRVSPDDIQEKCSVGYRAQRIVNFAKQVAEGKIDLAAIEKLADEYLKCKCSNNKSEAPAILDKLKKRLLSINGFGEFSANNILQLLGIFDIIPSDSETARHLREQHKINLKNAKDVHKEAQNIYAKYEPFQFLVYWYNLYEYHQRFSAGFPLELATPPPLSYSSSSSSTTHSTTTTITSTTSNTSSTTSTTISTKITKTTITTKKEKKEKKEGKKRGQKRTIDNEPLVEESPRRSKRLSMQKS